MPTLLDVLTKDVSFDSSGRLRSSLTQWTENNIYEVFRKMLLDDRIAGALMIRSSKALSYGWDVIGEDENDERAIDVRSVLERLEIIEKLDNVWNAAPFGFALNEIEWASVEGHFEPVGLIAIPNEYVELTPLGPKIKIQGQADIETWKIPYKYIVTVYKPLFNSPEGSPVLAGCYWPWVFKRQGYRFWAKLLDKFGTPSLAALFTGDYPHRAADLEATANCVTVEDIQEGIVTALGEMRDGGNVAVSNIDDLRVIEATGHGEDFERFITMQNNAISIQVLGNTMTMDAQSRGSQALGTVHQEISEQVSKRDTSMLRGFLNTLIRWYVDLNYGIDVPAPRFSWDLDGETSWDAVKDAMDHGVPVSLRAVYYKIRGYEPVDEADAFVVPTMTQAAPGEVGMSRPFASRPAPRKIT